jgi:hypothetical protein
MLVTFLYGYARNKIKSNATGHHFSLPGHSEKNMKFTIIEQPKYNQLEYREEREKYHMKKFDTFYNVMVLAWRSQTGEVAEVAGRRCSVPRPQGRRAP